MRRFLGIAMSSASKKRAPSKYHALKSIKHVLPQMLSVVRIFNEIDHDGSNLISIKELKACWL